jgi:hypothetical protein
MLISILKMVGTLRLDKRRRCCDPGFIWLPVAVNGNQIV